MTDTSNNTSVPIPAEGNRRRGRGRTVFFVALIALAAGLTGAFASSALSQHGFGFGPPGWHGRGFMGRMDPAQIEDRADRAVRHLAIEIDATNEQQERLRAVVKSAVKDLLPMRDQAQSARLRGRELLVKPDLDRAAIEAFRAEHMALADAFSRRIAQALGDVAEILTLEQRRKVADLIPPRPGFWRRWHRG
jgi:periplasmic protein CpxP/Spy